MDAAMDRPRLLAGLLKRAGDYSVATFRDRLVLQKTVYLLQAFGIYLGYRFTWYLHGPYSTQLTRDAFGLQPDWSANSPVHFTNEASEHRFRQFLQFVEPNQADGLWLETIASAHFLARVHGERDKYVIFQKIKIKQPRVTRRQFDDCWTILEREQLL